MTLGERKAVGSLPVWPPDRQLARKKEESREQKAVYRAFKFAVCFKV